MQITVVISFITLILLNVVLSAPTVDDEYNAALQRRLYDDLRRMQHSSSWASRGLSKRAPHQIEARALNQFKNCYFSPIQCVLMERRR